MDPNQTIKIRLLITLIFSIFCIPVLLQVSAASYIIESKKNTALSKKSAETLSQIMSRSEIAWGEIAEIDLKNLIRADTLFCILDNEQVELFATYHTEGVDYYYTHYESSDKDAHAYLSVLTNNIQIDISTSLGVYNIYSISESEVALLRLESDIPEEPAHNETIFNEEIPIRDAIEEDYPTRSMTPVIRVLFVYTNAALNLMGSYQPYIQMKQVVYNYINKANESFIHSNIDAHMQLAYIGPITYDETSQTWSDVLDHFCNNNDGYMDEVHNLRDKYTADVCVLFLDKNDYCGEARTIKANANTAFCLVNPTGFCNNKFTAVHEIGHLIGCRHNYEQDMNLIPYAYGHGYIHYENNNPSSSWRTMMAYDNSCATGCGRIPYWSNPDVYYNGIVTGTSSIANNARVWNNRASIVADFRTTPDNISYTNTDNNYSSIFESVEANTQIITGSGYEIQSGQIVEFRTSSSIRFLPNTNIKKGAYFRAYIHSSANIGSYPQFAPVNNESSFNKEESIVREHKLSIYPNPAIDIINVNYDEELMEICIYSIDGELMHRGFNTSIHVSSFPDGLYIVHAKSSDGKSLQGKFLKR
ncbi:MAG: zinc-dependent metalloprotease [Paludibacteraceae bacterium]|nr:zinc-dependent metalloprotease [Paludibacteraceae bacterium]